MGRPKGYARIEHGSAESKIELASGKIEVAGC
jgi:hypothetical protein